MEMTDELTVTMTVGEWNQVLAIFAESPYRIVAPLIAKIHQAAVRAEALEPATTSNGRLTETLGAV